MGNRQVKKTTKTSITENIHVQLGFNEFEDSRRAIGRVMHVIRGMLTDKEASALSFKLPNDLLVIYLSSWPLVKPNVDIAHLDEFVKAVKNIDVSKSKVVFNTEIEVLKCSLLVLSELDKEVEILKVLPQTLQQDIRTALIHPAA